MAYKFDYLVYIGRFQPFHKGHMLVVRKALELSENLIMVMGSHQATVTSKNPFTTFERSEIIIEALKTEPGFLERTILVPQVDHTYNMDRWVGALETAVNSAIHRVWRADKVRIGIVGYDKDHSSFYLRHFPDWELVEVEPYRMATGDVLSATRIRDFYYTDTSNSKEPAFGSIPSDAGFFASPGHMEKINSFLAPKREALLAEVNYLRRYKKLYGPGPFLSGDSLITFDKKILIIKRGGIFGNGLLALPGGFMNLDETIEQCAFRELDEETSISVSPDLLRKGIRERREFDAVGRDLRARIITNCFRIDLDLVVNQPPSIKAGDDAFQVSWMDIRSIQGTRGQWFADHYDIIESMISL